MKEPPLIEHNSNEKRPPKWFWWVIWAFIGMIWLFQIGQPLDRHSFFLGFITAFALCSWSYDVTGGIVPDSWRRKPSRRR